MPDAAEGLATEKHVPDSVSYDTALNERVIALGREGRSRAEIAVELGVSIERIAAWADKYRDFADALEFSASASRAWWDAQSRLAVWKNDTFHATAWSRAMAQRFGSPSHRTADAAEPEAPPPARVRIEIPANGREARRRAPERAGD